MDLIETSTPASSNDSFHAPEVLAGDYFQVVYNVVCIVIGVPLNVVTLVTLILRQRK